MEPGTVLGLISVLLTLIGGIYVARVNGRTTDRTSRRTHDVGMGELAVKIAERADKRSERTEQQLGSIRKWYKEQHEPWDEDVYSELTRLDPSVAARLGKPTPMPED